MNVTTIVSRNNSDFLVHTDTPSIVEPSIKTRSLWQRFVDGLGCTIRDLFFLPISSTLPPAAQAILEKEKEFVRRFWNPSVPIDLNYPHQQEIRDAFRVYDATIQHLVDGEILETTCRIIESKDMRENFINFVQVQGSVATIDNDITTIYPYLAAHVESRKQDPTLPSARFILISHYNTTSEKSLWKPKTIDQWGTALTQVLETLSKKFDKIHCLIGHSIGTVAVATALSSLSLQAIPSLLAFERAPSSIASVSREYWAGSLLHLLASKTGWSVDLGKELHDFYEREPDTTCLISGVEKDFYFAGQAGLTQHPLVSELEAQGKVKVYLFNPPNQLFHPRAHHNLRADLLNGNYLIRSSNQTAMEKSTLASTIFFHVLERLSLPLQKAAG